MYPEVKRTGANKADENLLSIAFQRKVSQAAGSDDDAKDLEDAADDEVLENLNSSRSSLIQLQPKASRSARQPKVITYFLKRNVGRYNMMVKLD